jgi:hypothetical protein
MEEYTVEDYKAAARNALADGNEDAVRFFADKARALEMQQSVEAEVAAADTGRGLGAEAAYSGGAGAIRGAAGTVDFAGSILPAMQRLGQRAGETLYSALPFTPDPAPRREYTPPAVPTLQEIAAEKTGGYSEYRSPTLLGQVAGTVGEFGGGAAVLPIGGPVKSVMQSVLPAIASETAGQITKGTAAEGPARLAAALLTPAAQTAARAGARRMALGPAKDVFANVKGAKIKEAVGLLEAQGIPIEEGQAVGSKRLMNLQDTLEPSLSQKVQLTRAALKSAGVEGDVLATDGVMKGIRKRVGKVFDKADELSTVVPTEDDGMRAMEALDDALGMASIAKVAPKLTGISDRLSSAAGNGKTISANDIKTTRSELNRLLGFYAKQNDQVNYELAYELLDTIDDMAQRQIAQSDPEFLGEFLNARKEYRAYLTLERAVNRAGSDSGRGIITPDALVSSVRNREGSALVRGVGTDLADLAKASQQVLTPAPAVSAGGVRDVGGAAKGILDIAPSMAARMEGSSLRQPTGSVLREDLLRRLLSQTGGILSID